jgi:hypothetical protein
MVMECLIINTFRSFLDCRRKGKILPQGFKEGREEGRKEGIKMTVQRKYYFF